MSEMKSEMPYCCKGERAASRPVDSSPGQQVAQGRAQHPGGNSDHQEVRKL